MYVAKGASVDTALKLAEELTAHDAFAAHIDAELGIDPNALNKSWHAHSFPVIAFTVGSILPIVAIQLPPAGSPGTSHTCRGTARPHRCNEREPGRRALGPAVARIVIADALAIAVTHGIGQLVGAAGI